MALFSMRVQIISRKTRTAVAAAAYRACDKLTGKDGTQHDYTRKGHLEHAEILAPTGAPAWMSDRQQLWQTVDQLEKHPSAQLAREIRIMLPREFTADQRIEVARDFIQKEFVDRGMVADIAWHNPKASDGRDNPHVHVMLTMRPIVDGAFGKKCEGTRATQKRTTEWNSDELYQSIRESWARTCNRVLSDAGSQQRIDHRSYQERGIEIIPQPYLGVAARMRELSSNMRGRINQWMAQRAKSKAWGFAQKALDARIARFEGKVNGAADAVDLVGRFVTWIDKKIDRAVGDPHRAAREIQHTNSRDQDLGFER